MRDRIIELALKEVGRVQPPYPAKKVCGAFIRRMYEACGLPLDLGKTGTPGEDIAKTLPATTEPEKADLVRYPNGHCGLVVCLTNTVLTSIEGVDTRITGLTGWEYKCSIALAVRRVKGTESYHSIQHLIDRVEMTGGSDCYPIELGVD